MYRTFGVKNFRGFDDLTVEGLGRINLIAGKNNVGKTALLEALWVHSGAVNADLAVRVDTFRGLEQVAPDSFLGNLFHGFDRELTVELNAEGSWADTPRRLRMWFEDSSTVQLPLSGGDNDRTISQQSSSMVLESSDVLVMDYSYESEGQITTKARLVASQVGPGIRNVALEMMFEQGEPLQGRPIAIFLSASRSGVSGEDVNRYSQLEIKGQQDGVLQILQEVEPRLKRLAVVSAAQASAIYADVGLERLIPVQLMGDGMSRILSLALAIASAPGGTVLVDEIENGLHHSVMERLWKAIASFARSYNVQLFATTHSYECIGAAYRAFESDEDDDLRLYRIELSKGKMRAVTYDRARLKTVLEFNMGFI